MYPHRGTQNVVEYALVKLDVWYNGVLEREVVGGEVVLCVHAWNLRLLSLLRENSVRSGSYLQFIPDDGR